MTPSTAPPLPKYYKLAEHLRQQISSGQLTSGDQIRSEPALCAAHNLSRGTVRQAIQMLVDEGLLVREQGRGTFVASPNGRSQHFSLSNFADEMRRQHRQPSTQLLTAEQLPATPLLAAKLKRQLDSPILHIKRIRLADGRPVALETRYLAQQLCPDLLSEDLENSSLHWLFVHKYNIPLVRLEHTVEINPLDPHTAHLLQTPPHTPAFHVDRLTFTNTPTGEKIPAVWFQAIYSQEQYAIQTQTL